MNLSIYKPNYQAAVKLRHSDLIDISPHKIICKRVFAGIPVILRELLIHPCLILQCYLVKYCFFWFHKYLNSKFLKGKKVVITAGGTKENFDPVRYIGNYSSGKMGAALAKKAFEAGASVTLIETTPLLRDCSDSINTVDVVSAKEMLDAVKEEFLNKNADILIMTAAVADYRPETTEQLKVKKENTDELTIKLVKNPDILSEMCKLKKEGMQIVGFCAETNDLIENAKAKIKRKGCDWLVANDVSRKDTGFSSDFNEVYVLDKNLNIVKIDKDTKENIASKILEQIWQKQAK